MGVGNMLFSLTRPVAVNTDLRNCAARDKAWYKKINCHLKGHAMWMGYLYKLKNRLSIYYMTKYTVTTWKLPSFWPLTVTWPWPLNSGTPAPIMFALNRTMHVPNLPRRRRTFFVTMRSRQTAGTFHLCRLMGRKKKLEMRLQGRTDDELLDRPLFACCDRYEQVETVAVTGLRCAMTFLNTGLGQFQHDDDDRDVLVDDAVCCSRRVQRASSLYWRHSSDVTRASPDVILPCLLQTLTETTRQIVAVTSVRHQCTHFVFFCG